jgi:hypothetical protein
MMKTLLQEEQFVYPEVIRVHSKDIHVTKKDFAAFFMV